MPKNVAKTFGLPAEKGRDDLGRDRDIHGPKAARGIDRYAGTSSKDGTNTKKRDIKKEGKGRPVHSYKLAIPFEKMIETIEKEEKNRSKESRTI